MNDELKFYTDTDAHPVIVAPAYPGDAGYDLAVSGGVCIQPKSFQRVQLDLFVAIPDGHVGLIKDRSGHASGGLHILGGVIDSSFRGRIAVVFANFSDHTKRFEPGDRVAQLLIMPVNTPALTRVAEHTDLGATVRGANGFMSSGLQMAEGTPA